MPTLSMPEETLHPDASHHLSVMKLPPALQVFPPAH